MNILRPSHIYNCTQYSPMLRSCSASWRWASNARNMSRHWTSIKCKWKWSVHQVGCVYYVITSLWCTVNKTLKTRYSFRHSLPTDSVLVPTNTVHNNTCYLITICQCFVPSPSYVFNSVSRTNSASITYKYHACYTTRSSHPPYFGHMVKCTAYESVCICLPLLNALISKHRP
jgi:hypothetical protein